jgi:DNA-binding response OmpR family regulator
MAKQSKKILIVEDEWKIARFIQMELEYEGYETGIQQDGINTVSCIAQEHWDLVLLDIMLPGLDGFEVCQRIRKISDIPIIMLTAKDSVTDKVTGLDSGANDYLTKPFAIQELLARIRAIFRNHFITDSTNVEILQIKDLKLYPKRYELEIGGMPVELTKKEYDLFEYMVRNKNIVLGRERILQEVWGFDYIGDTNIVDVYIRYLRTKIDERFNQKYISTVRGVGYVIKD